MLVSAAGPFLTVGRSAVAAAVDAGAIYLDSSGEPPFIRQVFEEFGPRAERTGALLLTAFGYDYVPGNLAGALALEAAGPAAARVQVGYFVRGKIREGTSAGTRASVAGVLLAAGRVLEGPLGGGAGRAAPSGGSGPIPCISARVRAGTQRSVRSPLPLRGCRA